MPAKQFPYGLDSANKQRGTSQTFSVSEAVLAQDNQLAGRNRGVFRSKTAAPPSSAFPFFAGAKWLIGTVLDQIKGRPPVQRLVVECSDQPIARSGLEPTTVRVKSKTKPVAGRAP